MKRRYETAMVTSGGILLDTGAFWTRRGAERQWRWEASVLRDWLKVSILTACFDSSSTHAEREAHAMGYRFTIFDRRTGDTDFYKLSSDDGCYRVVRSEDLTPAA